jgi:hypothetical protein
MANEVPREIAGNEEVLTPLVLPGEMHEEEIAATSWTWSSFSSIK